ncbi:ABC transporter substrate-binding protein [Streptomyces sp. NBC_01077]|uniref:ABC transporter substrate-binding protein n=1 Tax=Streptomyces sp. NBC_01077 TaxID=2903746 RepID=UPI003870DF21|nr:ABC transporter substrate-binding protein [Streptomyces sp. NBC_01077]WSV43574.1 ABC transporter substrate-binding protein [Streptomyces sp. NBC_01077]
MNRNTQICSGTLLVALAFPLVSCTGSPESKDAAAQPKSQPAPAVTEDGGAPAPEPLAKNTKVTIAMAALAENFAGVLLADQMGEFKKENLDVSVQVLPTTETLTSMAQGRIQFQPSGLTAATLNGISSGDTYRVVGFMYDTIGEIKEGIWIGNKYFDANGKVDPEKVRGMKLVLGPIGIGQSTAGSASKWLQSIGLSLEDVQIVNMSPPDTVVAMKQGAVDGAYLLGPFWQQVEASGKSRYVTGTRGNVASYMMPTRFMEEKPEVAEAIMRAVLRTHRTYLDGDYHKDPEVVKALSKAMKVPSDVFTKTETPFKFTSDFQSAFAEKATLDLQGVWLNAGGVLSYKEPLPPERIVDLNLARKVAGEQ